MAHKSKKYLYFRDGVNTQLAFICYYWYRFLKNLFSWRKPVLLKPPLPTVTELIHNDKIQQTWCDFFGLTRENCLTPFIRFNKCSSFILFDKMEHNHLSFKNLVHVKTEAKFLAHDFMFTPNAALTMTYELFDIIPLAKSRLALIIHVMAAHSEKVLYETKIIFVIKKVPKKFLDEIKQQHGYVEDGSFNNLRQIKPILSSQTTPFKSISFYIDKDLGRRYGLLSGDLNPLHSNDFFARLIGGKQSFIQGLCTLNLILAQFMSHGIKIINTLDILFCQFIYTGQTVTLNYTHHEYELIDKDNNLLVKGTYS